MQSEIFFLWGRIGEHGSVFFTYEAAENAIKKGMV